MSLKDLLPPGSYDEIVAEVNDKEEQIETNGKEIKVRCPICKKEIVYDVKSPFRPFCSQRCKLIDLGEWADEKRTIKGRAVNEDQDADLLNDPNLPKRNIPQDNF